MLLGTLLGSVRVVVVHNSIGVCNFLGVIVCSIKTSIEISIIMLTNKLSFFPVILSLVKIEI